MKRHVLIAVVCLGALGAATDAALAATRHTSTPAIDYTATGSSGHLTLVSGDLLNLEFASVPTDGGYSWKLAAQKRTGTASLTVRSPSFAKASGCAPGAVGCAENELLPVAARGVGTVVATFDLDGPGGGKPAKTYTLHLTLPMLATGSSGRITLTSASTLSVEFPAVTTDGGDHWALSATSHSGTATLKAIGEPAYANVSTCSAGAVGCPQNETFALKPGGRGHVTLTFHLLPPGRAAKALKTYVLAATVG